MTNWNSSRSLFSRVEVQGLRASCLASNSFAFSWRESAAAPSTAQPATVRISVRMPSPRRQIQGELVLARLDDDLDGRRVNVRVLGRQQVRPQLALGGPERLAQDRGDLVL